MLPEIIAGMTEGSQSGGLTVFGGTPSAARGAELLASPYSSEFPHGQTIACVLHGVVCYSSNVYTFRDSAMNKLDEYTVRGGLVCLNSAARFDKWNRAAVR